MKSTIKSRRRSLRGGKRTQLEKDEKGEKCAGEMDSVTFNPIPVEYAIRLKENEHYFCFDIRSLNDWFKEGKRTNPLTNLKFSDANIDKVFNKIQKVGLATLMRREHLWFNQVPDEYGVVKMYDPGFTGNEHSSIGIRHWKSRNDNIESELQNGPQNWFYEIIPSGRDGIIEIFSRDQMSYDFLSSIIKGPILGEPNINEHNYAAWEY